MNLMERLNQIDADKSIKKAEIIFRGQDGKQWRIRYQDSFFESWYRELATAEPFDTPGYYESRQFYDHQDEMTWMDLEQVANWMEVEIDD